MSEPYIPFATFRPIDVWPGRLLDQDQRRYSQFSASWLSTLDLLKREIGMIEGTDVIVQMALRENQIRRDGFPRSEARPEHPGVILAFDSKFGPLKYATDRFTKWEDNIRAIALGLESLRAVDRYGITKRGEQYSGWKQLTAGPASDPEQVARGRYLIDVEFEGNTRAALKATHPDAGGDREDDFKAISAAKEAAGE